MNLNLPPKHKFGTALGLALLVGGLLVPAAHAYSYRESYVPPEVAFFQALQETITLPAQVNINQISLNELKVLPGFDEDLALKVIRYRPMSDVQDFYKLPGLEKKQVDQLIRRVQPKLIFK